MHTQDGLGSLQALDRVAHDKWFNEASFLNFVIPSKARELAKRLIDGLVEMFSERLPRKQAQRLALKLHAEKTAAENLFKVALKFKKDMILRRDYCRLVWVEQGATHDFETMEIAQEDRGNSFDLIEITQRVNLCLSPGLLFQDSGQKSRNQRAVQDGEWRNMLVRTDVFMPKDQSYGNGISGYDLLCKAVVLLQQERVPERQLRRR
jgi:hypothetical protein